MSWHILSLGKVDTVVGTFRAHGDDLKKNTCIHSYSFHFLIHYSKVG